MFKSLPRAIISVLFLLIIGFGLFIFLAYIYGVPDSKISILMFKVGYGITPSKRMFLEAYSPKLRDVNAGYVPEEVSEFLCQKLEKTEDENEIAAIVKFYIFQSPGREDGILRCSDKAGGKIAKQIVVEMKDDSHFYGKIVLIEEIRQNKSFGKGNVAVGSPSKWKAFTDDLIPLVRQKYQEWWNLSLVWEEKRKINPLEGINIKVSECCG